MNKIGAEKILAIYWLAILLIVTFGIWAMAYAYYQHPLDIREIEVRTLSNKIANCISYKGEMREVFFDDKSNFRDLTEEEFRSLCHFNPQVEQERKQEEYYIEVNFFDVNENKKFSRIVYGESSIKTHCTGESQDFERLPKCDKRRFYTLNNKNQQILVEIFTGVRKIEKNVKI